MGAYTDAEPPAMDEATKALQTIAKRLTKDEAVNHEKGKVSSIGKVEERPNCWLFFPFWHSGFNLRFEGTDCFSAPYLWHNRRARRCTQLRHLWDETKQKVQNSNLFLEPMEGPKDEEMEQMYLSWKICHEILPASKLPTPEKNRVARGPKFQTWVFHPINWGEGSPLNQLVLGGSSQLVSGS